MSLCLAPKVRARRRARPGPAEALHRDYDPATSWFGAAEPDFG